MSENSNGMGIVGLLKEMGVEHPSMDTEDESLRVILVDELRPEDVIVIKLPPRPGMTPEQRHEHENRLTSHLHMLFPLNRSMILPAEVSLEIKRGAQ